MKARMTSPVMVFPQAMQALQAPGSTTHVRLRSLVTFFRSVSS